MLYSGSVLPGSGDNYRGVGLELHGGGNSGSLRYRVDDSGSFLEITGSIYATSGYFAGIISASIGGYIANWEITQNDLRAMSTVTNVGGIKLISAPIPAVQFYTQSAGTESIWASMEADVTPVVTYTGLTEYVASINFNIGTETATGAKGASVIFNMDYSNPTVDGDFVILGSNNIIFNASSSIAMDGPSYFYDRLYIDGVGARGKYGRIYNYWLSQNHPGQPESIPSYEFVSNEYSYIQYYGAINTTWTNGNKSNAAVYGVNNNALGYVNPPNFSNSYTTQTDIINAGVTGYNIRPGISTGLAAGVYAKANGKYVYESILDKSVSLLADAAPGTNTKSGVFRWGKFYIGDPWNDYSGSKRIVFYVDGAPMMAGTDNPNFGRTGLNTPYPQYALHVTGQPAHGSVPASLGIIYASDDIIAFSDIRLKTNILQISSSVELIQRLTGVRFNKVNGTEHKKTNTRPVIEGERTKIGLIAQDVEKVLPEVVYTDDNGYKSIGYANIVALLIEGIKEQQKQIDELKEKIEKIKGI
jgi:hypothetical protein